MSNEELLTVFAAILGDLLGRGPLRLTMDTRRESVPDWDSFNYLNFIVAVETRMGVRFGVAEIESFQDVGAIVRRVQEVLA